MIKALKDMYFVSLNEDENTKTKSGLFLDTTWNPYYHATQNGIIESIPLSISDKYKNDVEIQINDKVYFHHFVHAQDNYIMDERKKIFKCPRFNLYAVIKNGIIIMVDDWIFASPIYEKEEDIQKKIGNTVLYTKASPDKKHLLAKAEYISKQASEQGIRVGDTVVFRKDADYEMKVEGRRYYRMKLANVVSVIRNDKLIPLRDEILIWDNHVSEEVRSSGIIIVGIKPQRQQQTKILDIGIQDEEKQFCIGDEILYHYGTGMQVEYEKRKYCILRQEEIAGLLKLKI